MTDSIKSKRPWPRPRRHITLTKAKTIKSGLKRSRDQDSGLGDYIPGKKSRSTSDINPMMPLIRVRGASTSTERVDATTSIGANVYNPPLTINILYQSAPSDRSTAKMCRISSRPERSAFRRTEMQRHGGESVSVDLFLFVDRGRPNGVDVPRILWCTSVIKGIAPYDPENSIVA